MSGTLKKGASPAALIPGRTLLRARRLAPPAASATLGTDGVGSTRPTRVKSQRVTSNDAKGTNRFSTLRLGFPELLDV